MLFQHRALEDLIIIDEIIQQRTLRLCGRCFFIERTCLLMSRLLKPVHQPIQLEQTIKKVSKRVICSPKPHWSASLR
ncbi:hypothetical protein BJG94_02120 [Rhizobium sp. Td3]|nr:hypothetical protein BJG94_02120 [Rhizobium sp. Td3]